VVDAASDWQISMHMLGIHRDPVASKKRIAKAITTDEDLDLNVYGYPQPNMAIIFFDPLKVAAPAASDFETLEYLSHLPLAEQVPAPKKLVLVLAELAVAS
jgi:hypothetical protein